MRADSHRLALGRLSRPAFLNSPIGSFFLVSTLITRAAEAHYLHGVRHDALLSFVPVVQGRRYGEITRWLSTREIPRAAAAAALAAFASCSECT